MLIHDTKDKLKNALSKKRIYRSVCCTSSVEQCHSKKKKKLTRPEEIVLFESSGIRQFTFLCHELKLCRM